MQTEPIQPEPSKAFLRVEGLTKSYVEGADPVFDSVNFEMAKGEFACIIGHSGCGKTTILNVLAGLDTASAGHVFMDGREVAGPSLDRGVVFQGHALMPWLSVRGNIAFGVASVKREWLNVAMTLEVKPLRKAFRVILPAAAPTILTGMRISMGIAWLVIVAAEMLVGGTGIGYFVWNEWNNLSLTNVIFAILVIGVVGMLLDLAFAQAQKWVTYVE